MAETSIHMIPAEAVEAAMGSMSKTVDALQPLFADADVRAVIDLRAIATQALEAAAPHIRAQALGDAADEIIVPGASSVAAAWLRTRAASRHIIPTETVIQDAQGTGYLEGFRHGYEDGIHATKDALFAFADERDKVHGSIRSHITTYELRKLLGVTDD